MSHIFDDQNSKKKVDSQFRYAAINSPKNLDPSSDLESSVGGSTSSPDDVGLPKMDVGQYDDDCLPPSDDNYGTFSR